MPITGSGIVAGGAYGAELAALTRRAVIPSLVVQVYKATPTLNLLLRQAQKAKGGLSQITAPVQGSSYVSFSWSDASGSFPQPSVQAASQNAEFNLCLGTVPIPFFGMESLVQSSEVIIPRLKAVMSDAKTVMVQQLSTNLFSDNSANGNIIAGLPQAYDDGTNVNVYGGINRTASPFFKSTLVTGAGAVLTRAGFIKFLVQQTALAGGEAPDFVILSPSDWTTLMQDFMTVERINTTPGSAFGKQSVVNGGFRGLMLGDTPIFFDPFLAKGTAFVINSKYLAAYISEDAAFSFSGFYSAIPNLQIANIGVVIVALQVVCTKPISGMQIKGIAGGAF